MSEIVEEGLRTVGENGKRGVITHRGSRLHTIHRHRGDGTVDILFSVAEHDFLLQQVLYGILHMSAALQFLQLDTVGGEPLAVGMFMGQLLFNLTVVVYLTFLCVYQQDLTWLKPSLLCHLRRVEVDDTCL